MTHFPLLSLIVFLPLAGALASWLAGPRFAPIVAVATSLVVLALAVVVWIGFAPGRIGFQFQDRAAWLPGTGASYHLGVDGVSLALGLLTAFLTPFCLVAGGAAAEARPVSWSVVVLLFETTLLGIFFSLDFLLFYLFYEAVLIPSTMMVGIWGGLGRARAALKFFLFTFAGSLFMLLALIAMWTTAGTTDIPALMGVSFSPTMQGWLFAAFVAAFGVKLPIWPLHSWLPDAYGEAPGGGLILFAGALGKAGGYGLYRFAIQMLPDASAHAAPLMIGSGLIAISYAAIVAFAQTDMRRMIAYSSFSHMGVVLVGLFTLTAEGIDGAVFQMIAHGVIIAGLFFTVAILERRTGTTLIADYAGAARRMPVLATLAMLFTMANLGLPGTGGFIGELLVIIGTIRLGTITAWFAAASMVLGAAYMLVMFRRVMFEHAAGKVRGIVRDLGPGEWAILAPLALVVLWMGVYPISFSTLFDTDVTTFAQQHLPNEDFTAVVLPRRLAAR